MWFDSDEKKIIHSIIKNNGINYMILKLLPNI